MVLYAIKYEQKIGEYSDAYWDLQIETFSDEIKFLSRKRKLIEIESFYTEIRNVICYQGYAEKIDN